MLKSTYEYITVEDSILSKCSFETLTRSSKQDNDIHLVAQPGFMSAVNGSVEVDSKDKCYMYCTTSRYSVASAEPIQHTKLSSLISGKSKISWSFVVKGFSNNWATGIVAAQHVNDPIYLYEEGLYGIVETSAECTNEHLHRVSMHDKLVTVVLDMVLLTASFIVDGVDEKCIKVPVELFPVHFMFCGCKESTIQFIDKDLSPSMTLIESSLDESIERNPSSEIVSSRSSFSIIQVILFLLFSMFLIMISRYLLLCLIFRTKLKTFFFRMRITGVSNLITIYQILLLVIYYFLNDIFMKMLI